MGIKEGKYKKKKDYMRRRKCLRLSMPNMPVWEIFGGYCHPSCHHNINAVDCQALDLTCTNIEPGGNTHPQDKYYTVFTVSSLN